MTPQEIGAALDAHDALVNACIDGSLTFEEFLGAYLGFPASLGLDARRTNGSHEEARLFRRRIAFHKRVAEILSGLDLMSDSADLSDERLAPFAPRIGLMRLRALCREHPHFEASEGAA